MKSLLHVLAALLQAGVSRLPLGSRLYGFKSEETEWKLRRRENMCPARCT